MDFIPDYTLKRGEKTAQLVTLRDMMTMTTPFKYKSAPYTKYFTSDNCVKNALALLGGKGEIGQFRYTNEHSFAAIGDGGNVIYINPAKNMVVAITALFKPRAKDRIELIKKQIEPIFEN